MRVCAWIPRALKRVQGAESGFTLIELISAVLVVSLGVIALITTLDSSRDLVTFSEAKETAVHIAEQELEKIQSYDYGQIALEDDPVPCNAQTDPVCDSDNPAYYLAGNVGNQWYRWDQRPWGQQCDANGNPRNKCEPLVIDRDTDLGGPDTAGKVKNIRDTFTTNGPSGGIRLKVEMQRFVTWVDDDCVKTSPPAVTPCGDSNDYKRITVAVRILGIRSSRREGIFNGGPGRPVILSTTVRDPAE